MSKKYDNIDDLFRDKFEDFEVDPPDYVWENVRSRIGNHNGNGRGTGLNKGGIAGITLLLIATGIITLFVLNNSAVVSKEATKDQGAVLRSEGSSLLAANTSAASPGNQPEPVAMQNETLPAPGKDKEKKAEKQEKRARIRGNNPNKNSSVLINPVVSSDVPPERTGRKPMTVEAISASPVVISGMDGSAGTITETTAAAERQYTSIPLDAGINGPDMVRGQNSPEAEEHGSKGIRTDYGAAGRWLIGLYFTPELIAYPSDNQLKNYSYSADLNFTYKINSYFLQSGFGFARNHDQGNSVIDYNKYLGSYEDVYDVTFDTTGNQVVPIYHTETVNVYDSINHAVISPTKRYFTYLQVPLFVGYGAESNRFGWFVKGGPSLSFMVNEKVPSSGLGDSKARILNIENELPGRISTHWQFIVSAGVTCKLGPRLSLSMEPMFRYYIKSVYEQDKINTKHPFSAGLRTGLLLSF